MGVVSTVSKVVFCLIVELVWLSHFYLLKKSVLVVSPSPFVDLLSRIFVVRNTGLVAYPFELPRGKRTRDTRVSLDPQRDWFLVSSNGLVRVVLQEAYLLVINDYFSDGFRVHGYVFFFRVIIYLVKIVTLIGRCCRVLDLLSTFLLVDQV